MLNLPFLLGFFLRALHFCPTLKNGWYVKALPLISYAWTSREFLHVKYSERISSDEVISNALALAGDPRFDHTHYVLGDWSHYMTSSLEEADVRALVAIMKSVCNICPYVKNATVIRPDRSGNALVAFYKMLADELPWQIEIFHSFEEAFDWFELPMPNNLTFPEHANSK